MQRLLFEYSPVYLFVCALLGMGYAYVLYQSNYHWSKRTNQLLFGLRALLVTLLASLLLGPIIKLTQNHFEKPAFVFLIDDSGSVRETTDSLKRQKILSALQNEATRLKEEDYDVVTQTLSGQLPTTFNGTTSDLSGAIRSITASYEGKNLAGVAFVSDGIYNSGTSPLYLPLRIPIYTIGVGDTTDRVDLILKNIAFNKIAYQGNQFPLRAEVVVKGLPHQNVTVSVQRGGKSIGSKTLNSGTKSLLSFDFQAEATEKGLQRLDVIVESAPAEVNTKNNKASAFVEVVEGKKKILLIASSPHPDIKALRSVVEKNPNYEFHVHIPSVKEAAPALLQPGAADLVIFQQVQDVSGRTTALYNTFAKSNTSLLLMITGKSNLRQLVSQGIPLAFENMTQTDEVTAVVNDQFPDFSFSENANSVFAKYPPVTVPFGKFTYPPQAHVVLWQRIGSVVTNRPLVVSWEEAGKKTAAITGEGIWKWRLSEYDDHGNTEIFDEVFGKLIQYLSTKEDKRKFRSFPLQNEFTDAEAVVFESQVFNDLFEPVYGNTIELELRDEKGTVAAYNYVIAPGNPRYRIAALKEGVYKYKASTLVNGKKEEIRGEFLVSAQNMESQNLTADFNLLRKLAAETGGRFYSADQADQLSTSIQKTEAKSIIHSEDSFNSIINLKMVFFLLLLLISAEWFMRKYWGSY